MSDKLVNVLISTYNGEHYIEAQIDSILHQTYQPIRIYVRDDGSKDRTCSILERYQEQLGEECFCFIKGDNVGFGQSFLELLRCSSEGEYWAFCDQDDVWLPDKVSHAMQWFASNDSDKPLMYHSAFYVTDESLNPMSEYLPPSYEYDFVRSITDCLHMGFSDVLNRPLRELVLRADFSQLNTHDHFVELVVMEFGEVFFDDKPACYHRRLDTSVSGGDMKSRIRWFCNALGGENEILPTIREFYRVFANEMKEEDRKRAEWFVYEHYDFLKAIKKAFYYKRWRPSLSSEIVIRLLMLIGKL